MNQDQKNRLFELFTTHAADMLTAAEHDELQSTLRADAEARQLWFVHQDVEMGLRAHPAIEPVAAAETTVPVSRGTIRKPWRPLMAAAAGLVFGMLGTSMVFGFVVQRGIEKKVSVALFEPGFEDAQMPLAKDFPNASARWGGDLAAVVGSENGVIAKEGKFMLKLEAPARGPARLYQVLDLESLPSGGDAEMREIEISASFAAADTDASVRYLLRAFAVSDAPEDLGADWFDRREESIASSTRGFDAVSGDRGWQTFGLRIHVPRSARSLVLFFGLRTPDRATPEKPHYLDDVQVSLIESVPLP